MTSNKKFSKNLGNDENRVWQGLTKYVPKDNFEQIMIFENDLEALVSIIGKMDVEALVSIIGKMDVNNYIIARTQFVGDKDPNYFNNFIDYLRKEYELDIGKGNSEFGYKMPLPKNNEEQRNLIIFRRWKKD